jgi:hypothetical protein
VSEWIIEQGTDSGIKWPVTTSTGSPIDFTGWTGEVQIRALNTDKLIYRFRSEDSNLVLTEDSEIVVTYSNVVTSAWTWKQANFGIELTNPEGKKIRVKQGIVTLSKEVVK